MKHGTPAGYFATKRTPIKNGDILKAENGNRISRRKENPNRIFFETCNYSPTIVNPE
jgi:hypothetical protein